MIKVVTSYRFILFASVITVHLIFLFAHYFYSTILIPWSLQFPFVDIHTITGAAECTRAGLDPYIVTTFDPFRRTFNYPRLWITIFNFFNINKSATNLLGISMAGAFVLTTNFLFQIKTRTQFFFVFALLISPPVLLALERANSDIIIFLLVSFALFYLRKIPYLSSQFKLYLRYLAITLSILLKIYPFLLPAILIFEKAPRKNLLFILCYSIGFIFLYFAYTYSDLLAISSNTPREEFLSYGKNVFLQTYLKPELLFVFTNLSLVLLLITALFININLKNILSQTIPVTNETTKNIYPFLGGGLIYVGTFFIGNNWDYRLIFLLLCIPFILDILTYSTNKVIRFIISLSFLTLFYSFYIFDYFYRSNYLLLAKFLSSWTIYLLILIVIIYLVTKIQFVKDILDK